MRFSYLFVAFVGTFLNTNPQANASDGLDATSLAADAFTLRMLLAEEHASPHWLNSKETIEGVAADIHTSIDDEAGSEALLAQMLRLIAAVGDGHTVMASGDRYAAFGLAPFFAWPYEDGVFIERVVAGRDSLLGAEILAVGGVSIKEAFSRLRSVVPHSTDARFRRWVRSYLHLPGLLHALGLSDSPESVNLTLRLTDGSERVERFDRIEASAYSGLEMVDISYPETLRDRNADANYWFEPLPDSDAVYFNFRRVASSDDGESIWAFGLRLAETLRERRASRLIIDLRENGGGGYQFAAHLRPLLRSVPSLDRPGGIVVLTGPKTYSAASNFLSQLQRFTDSTLIGTPPAGRLGEPGDDDDYTLPRTGLTVRISQVADRSAAVTDRRGVVGVDVLVPDRFADRKAGVDRALDVARAHAPKTSASAETPDAMAGRYAFQADADLLITQRSGRWRASVLPQFDTPLTPVGEGRLTAALPGLTLMFEPDQDAVRVIFADGSQKRCPRSVSKTPGPWELVYQGRIDEARPLFKQAIAKDPDALSLTDSTFSSEAIHLVYTLQDGIGPAMARQKARQLLELAIDLLPGGAPESEFSLRFYPKPD